MLHNAKAKTSLVYLGSNVSISGFHLPKLSNPEHHFLVVVPSTLCTETQIIFIPIFPPIFSMTFLSVSACLLFILMEFRATPAVISTVIVIVGFIFICVTVAHSAFSWRVEKNKADRDIPAYGTVPMSKNELSTLV